MKYMFKFFILFIITWKNKKNIHPSSINIPSTKTTNKNIRNRPNIKLAHCTYKSVIKASSASCTESWEHIIAGLLLHYWRCLSLLLSCEKGMCRFRSPCRFWRLSSAVLCRSSSIPDEGTELNVCHIDTNMSRNLKPDDKKVHDFTSYLLA